MISLTKAQHNLDCGEIYTYLQICELLTEKRANGTSTKKAQYKIWKRYFDFDILTGGRILVTEIHDKVMPKEIDGRSRGNHTVYIELIEMLLLDFLIKQKDYNGTKKELYKILGMANVNFGNYTVRLKEELTDRDVDIFYNRAHKKLGSILDNSLKSFSKRTILSYKKMLILVESEPDCIDVPRYATAEEVDKIDKIKKAALEELGLQDERQVYLKYKSTEYYNIINEFIYNNWHIKKCYSVYKIEYNKNQMKKNPVSLLSDDNRRSMMQQLNQKVIDAVNKDAEAKYANNLKKLEAYEESASVGRMKYTGFVYNSGFVEHQKQLADFFLKLAINMK